MKVKTTGGKKLAAMIRKLDREARQTPVTGEVGFFGQVAPLAKQLEFGDPKRKLPERPAFRQALPDAAKAVHDVVKRSKADAVLDTESTAGKAIAAATEAVKRSYLDFVGDGLSERQRKRKEGTPYERKELQGGEGPKLIERIEGKVDGEPVD